MKEENDIDLCIHMNSLRANHDMLNMLWRDGRLRAMADRLAAVQAAAREAEYRVNDLLRGVKSSAGEPV